jgi:hypothetical protein
MEDNSGISGKDLLTVGRIGKRGQGNGGLPGSIEVHRARGFRPMNVAAECATARQELPLPVQDLNRLVIQHAPLIKRIGYHLMGRLHESGQIEDLL